MSPAIGGESEEEGHDQRRLHGLEGQGGVGGLFLPLPPPPPRPPPQLSPPVSRPRTYICIPGVILLIILLIDTTDRWGHITSVGAQDFRYTWLT